MKIFAPRVDLARQSLPGFLDAKLLAEPCLPLSEFASDVGEGSFDERPPDHVRRNPGLGPLATWPLTLILSTAVQTSILVTMPAARARCWGNLESNEKGRVALRKETMRRCHVKIRPSPPFVVGGYNSPVVM